MTIFKAAVMAALLLSLFNEKNEAYKKVLTAETVRTLLFYSDKHINVNITPA